MILIFYYVGDTISVGSGDGDSLNEYVHERTRTLLKNK